MGDGRHLPVADVELADLRVQLLAALTGGSAGQSPSVRTSTTNEPHGTATLPCPRTGVPGS